MLDALKQEGYVFSGYGDWQAAAKPVILRHDIDFDLAAALTMAELEAREGVKSTFFVLLRTDFYNPLEQRNVERLRRMASLGHEVGLHFDETQYGENDDMLAAIKREAAALESILEVPVRCVSMHRPSKSSIDADWKIPGIINSYSNMFFEGFEYVSDSRRHWRKPVMEVIRKDRPRLHILTHPFWYRETETSLEDSLERFTAKAPCERVISLDRNFTDLDTVLDAADVMAARLFSLRSEKHMAERIVLRPLRLEDASDMFEYTSQPQVSRFLNWNPHQTVGEAKAWIASKLARPEPDDLLFGMELRESHKLIGTVRAYNFEVSSNSCEVSYALNPTFQGCGYMAEALQKLIALCFEKVGVGRVIACIDEENAASAHVALRLGMTRVTEGDFTMPIKGENRLQYTYVLERKPQ